MGDGTGIEWTDATWNTLGGCWPVSPGCGHCYAAKVTTRLAENPAMKGKYAGLAEGGRFTGEVRLFEERLAIPLKWKAPRRIFVNSLGDLFHESVPFSHVDKVFAVMAMCPQHTFQVLTKRPERALEYFRGGEEIHHGGTESTERGAVIGCCQPGADAEWQRYLGPGESRFMPGHGLPKRTDIEVSAGIVLAEHFGMPDPETDAQTWNQWSGRKDVAAILAGAPWVDYCTPFHPVWPLPNVWLGVSAERQEELEERVPVLLKCPAAVRFVSAEPLLGALDARRYLMPPCPCCGESVDNRNGDERSRWCQRCGHGEFVYEASIHGIDWVIGGGESGAGARPCHPDWVRGIRDQCVAAGVAFFFKQWGEHSLHEHRADGSIEPSMAMGPGGFGETLVWKGGSWIRFGGFGPGTDVCEVLTPGTGVYASRVGKKRAGRLLDGREWMEWPAGASKVS